MSKVLQREIDEILNEEELIAQDVAADMYDDDIGYDSWLEYQMMMRKEEEKKAREEEEALEYAFWMDDDFYDDEE